MIGYCHEHGNSKITALPLPPCTGEGSLNTHSCNSLHNSQAVGQVQESSKAAHFTFYSLSVIHCLHSFEDGPSKPYLFQQLPETFEMITS